MLTDEQQVHAPLAQAIDDIVDSLVEYHQTHPGFEALWLQPQGDPRLARIYQDLTETLIKKAAWILARRYAKSDEASILRASQVCVRTTHALLTLAGDGPGLDSQIIAELKIMIRAYLQAVFGSESAVDMTRSISPLLWALVVINVVLTLVNVVFPGNIPVAILILMPLPFVLLHGALRYKWRVMCWKTAAF